MRKSDLRLGGLYRAKYDLPLHGCPAPNSPRDQFMGSLTKDDLVLLLEREVLYIRVLSKFGPGWALIYGFEEK